MESRDQKEDCKLSGYSLIVFSEAAINNGRAESPEADGDGGKKGQ
jgi:hypothetical protein